MIESHELANLFPLMQGLAFDELTADIKAKGILEDIVILDGKILDGRNRYRAAIAAGILKADDEPNFRGKFLRFDVLARATVERGPLAYVLSKNLARRHLDESQRAMVAAKLATMRQGERTELSANMRKVSQTDAASFLNVSARSIQSANKVRAKGSPELIHAVEQGRLPVSAAAQASTLNVAQQKRIVAEAEKGNANVVRTVLKREARATRESDLGTKQRALPDKRYGVIYADPEWRFEPHSRETGMDRAPENHYPTSTTDEIATRPVASIAANDCVLFLWATGPMIEHALRVMAAWGFEYVSQIVWQKIRPGKQRGPGYWFTGEHELLLLGTRGSVPAPAPGTQWPSFVAAPVGEHSEKPIIFYEMIEAYFPNLPKIELNARVAREGFDAWGLEAPTGERADVD